MPLPSTRVVIYVIENIESGAQVSILKNIRLFSKESLFFRKIYEHRTN
jgi:hypothetical protein